MVHLDVEDRSEELLAPALLCHKEPALIGNFSIVGENFSTFDDISFQARTLSAHFRLYFSIFRMLGFPVCTEEVQEIREEYEAQLQRLKVGRWRLRRSCWRRTSPGC